MAPSAEGRLGDPAEIRSPLARGSAAFFDPTRPYEFRGVWVSTEARILEGAEAVPDPGGFDADHDGRRVPRSRGSPARRCTSTSPNGPRY